MGDQQISAKFQMVLFIVGFGLQKERKKTFYGLLAFLYRTQKREGHSQEMGPAENLTKPSRQSRKDKMGVVSFKKNFCLFVFTVFGNRGER